MTFGNSAFTFAQQPTTGSLTPGVSLESKSLSSWQRAWLSASDTTSGGMAKIGAPLEQSEWVLAAVKLLAGPMASVPLQWWNSSDASGREPLADDSERASFWQNPSEDDFGAVSFEDVCFSLCAWLALQGEAFIVLPDDWLGRRTRGLSAPLICGRSEMSPLWGRSGDGLRKELAGYLFSGSGVSASLIPEQVIRMAWSNPFNRDRGLGAWAAAQVAADADRSAGVYAGNVAGQNGGNSDFIVTDGSIPNQEQQAQIIAGLKDRRERALRGDYAATFLGASLKVVSPADRAVSAALLTQRTANRESIAAAFGIPLSMLQQVTGSSLGEGRVDSEMRALIGNGTAPIARRIAAGFSKVEERRSRGVAFAEFDFDDHPAMRSARLALAQTAKTFVDLGIPLRSVNETLGLGFELPEEKAAPVAVELVSPADKVAAGLAEAAKMLRALGDYEGREGREEGKKDFAAVTPQQLVITVKAEGNTAPGNMGADSAMPAPTTGEGVPVAISMGQRKPRDKARTARWEKMQGWRKPFETRFKKAVSAVYKEVTAQAIASLAREIPQSSALEAAMPVKALVSLETKALSFAVIEVASLADLLVSAVMPVVSDAYAAGDEEARAELKAAGFSAETPREVGDFLKVRENYIRDSAQATHDALMESLNAGFDNGETMGQLAGRVKAVMRTEDDKRAVSIAVTETHTAFNVARQRQQEAAGVEYHEWLSAGDNRVRADHEAMDGTVMPVGSAFLLPGGVELMHPCAEGGPADQVINCRCIAVAVGGDEGERRFAEQTPEGTTKDAKDAKEEGL